MTRGVLNLIIDTVAVALLTAMVGTGYILWFALPPGTHRTHILWGLLRHQWGVVHFCISVALLTVLAVHAALHWRWLVMGLSKRFGVTAWAERSPRLTGLLVLAAAALPLTTLAIAAQVSVRPLASPLHPLVDASRAGAAPAAPGTADEQAAPSSPMPAQGTTPAAGPASGVRTPITSPGTSTEALPFSRWCVDRSSWPAGDYRRHGGAGDAGLWPRVAKNLAGHPHGTWESGAVWLRVPSHRRHPRDGCCRAGAGAPAITPATPGGKACLHRHLENVLPGPQRHPPERTGTWAGAVPCGSRWGWTPAAEDGGGEDR